MTLKHKIHAFLEHNEIFNYSIIVLIGLNVIAITVEALPEAEKYKDILNLFEEFTIYTFTIEYVLRIWSYHGSRLRYAFTIYSVIDLCAVLPYFLTEYAHYVVPFLSVEKATDASILRILRLIRLIAVLKIARYSEALQLFGRVLKRSKAAFAVSILAMLIILVLTSVLVYIAECDAQPHAFASIPHALWWGVATLTTVGYGDVYPHTSLGRFFGSIMALLSIGIFALPSGIIAAGFMEEMKVKGAKCPHCGKEIVAKDEH